MQQAACGMDDSGPRRLSIFQRLLLSIISRRLQGSAPGLAGISQWWGWQALIFRSRCCRPAFASHPSPSPRLCVILRPQGAPEVLTGEGCGEGSRHAHPSHLLGSSLSSHKGDTTNTVAFLGHARGCKVEGCRGYWSHESWLVGVLLAKFSGIL